MSLENPEVYSTYDLVNITIKETPQYRELRITISQYNSIKDDSVHFCFFYKAAAVKSSICFPKGNLNQFIFYFNSNLVSLQIAPSPTFCILFLTAVYLPNFFSYIIL
jgi:hypothetical protein